jgi:hypothetical protein
VGAWKNRPRGHKECSHDDYQHERVGSALSQQSLGYVSYLSKGAQDIADRHKTGAPCTQNFHIQHKLAFLSRNKYTVRPHERFLIPGAILICPQALSRE